MVKLFTNQRLLPCQLICQPKCTRNFKKPQANLYYYGTNFLIRR